MTEFVFDTYAIIEVIKGNPNYASYLDATPIINQFILAELCYCLLKEAGIEKSKLIVSTMTDHLTNVFLIKHLEKINPSAVVLCHADSVAEAGELYEMGASYVMMPHYIGSEKISTFIKRSGLKKSEFRKFRDKHLNYLQTHFTSPIE